uniref:Integrin alpha FG-GAP repeat containing 1 n=1 Tax=Astyanax mexicanus TaxID=7994 RepID=A0A3B1K530_ASTMX
SKRWEISVLALVLLFSGHEIASGLQDVTTDLFGTENKGTVAAFGDFNSDKQTDIFIIREQSELLIFLADLKAPYFKPKVHLTKNAFPSIISSVVPGDYDGDSQMDVLITGHPKSSDGQQTKIIVFWGNNQTLGKALINTHWPHYCKTALSTEVKFRVPHSNAFIDLNKDFTAGDSDTEVFKNSSSTAVFDTLVHTAQHTLIHLIHHHHVLWGFFLGSNFILFLFFFLLSDGDGSQDHLLPVCLDKDCTKSAIYLAKPSQDKWVPVLTDFQRRDSLWGFVPPEASSATALQPPITLHLGDYNLDGFPDALAILRNTNQQQAFLLENVPCTNASCRELGRMFRVHWEQSDLSAIHSAAVATFFDIYEDVMIISLSLSFSLTVLSGLCSNDCPNKVKPFGVNQPGPYVMYTSVDSNGYLKNASAGQLSQSAHLSLQLPYTVLGLGRSANFLDHLFVGIPRPPEQLLRNTIATPLEMTIIWSAKLYLTPSNIVLLTAIALIGVCVFILVIIGVLHWQEKKADDREKRQEAHRFHFDAM